MIEINEAQKWQKWLVQNSQVPVLHKWWFYVKGALDNFSLIPQFFIAKKFRFLYH